MKASTLLIAPVTLCLLFLCQQGMAQQSTDDAADVILAIEEQWEAVQSGDDWIDDKLHDRFSGWPNESPAPQSKMSTEKWNRFYSSQSRLVEHELFFQNIVVDGDVAVAHYYYTSANEDKDGKVEVNTGRYTDVLVRTDDGWKFLAWHGGESD